MTVLAVGYTLRMAQDLVLPVLLSIFFALVGNPIIRLLQRAFLPRFVGALLVMSGGVTATYLLGMELAAPAGEWVCNMPEQMQEITPKLRHMTKPVQEANKVAENIARAAGGDGGKTVQVVRTEVNDPYKNLTTTPRAIASILAVVLLTFFFMVYGQKLQEHAVALLPSRHQKRLTIDILKSIEHEISRYVLTISAINIVIGLVFATSLHFIMHVEMSQALLWGTMASLLNFAPFVGPLIGIMVMALMGLVTYDTTLKMVAPALIYLTIHTLEAQIFTPIVLGRRMALSPLMLILSLMVFGWVWGIGGLLLAVPLLVCVKIVLGKIDGMHGWATLLE